MESAIRELQKLCEFPIAVGTPQDDPSEEWPFLALAMYQTKRWSYERVSQELEQLSVSATPDTIKKRIKRGAEAIGLNLRLGLRGRIAGSDPKDFFGKRTK